MTSAVVSNVGSLAVSVESESVYFGHNVPIEIRDASMRLVNRAQDRRFDLPAGLYQVSAVLEDGQEHTSVVQVHSGKTTSVTLGARATKAPATRSHVSDASERKSGDTQATALALSIMEQWRTSRFTERADVPDEDPAVAAEPLPAAATLVNVKGARLVRETRTRWIFEGVDNAAFVPTATMQIGDRRSSISLPTSPAALGPNLCAVRIDPSPNGAHATAWISSERTVANALQNMLASGYLSSASTMADEAAQLLRSKYEDPTGATLAALILHKAGRLARLEGWMENLARDFAWIPDGKILLASLLIARREDLDRALGLALDAAKQRILYTDSYSILLDLLRRWPGDSKRSARLEATAALAADSPYIDWNSTCFSRELDG